MTDRDEEIIRMAREVGLGTVLCHNSIEGDRVWIGGADWHDELERFYRAAFAAGAAAKREACAKVCDTEADQHASLDRMIRNGYRKCAEGQRETQFCGQLEAAVAGAIAAEREACAIAGAAAAMAGKGYVGVAAAIRARGNV